MWKIRTFIGSISIKIPTDIIEKKNRPSFCGPAAIVRHFVRVMDSFRSPNLFVTIV